MQNTHKLKKIFITLMMLCFTIIGSVSAFAAESDTPHIAVSATASMEVAPDIAKINFDVNGTGSTASEAAAASASKLEAVRRALLGCNILSDDIITTSYTLYPELNNKGKVTGYTAKNSLTIKVKDIAKAGSVIDKLSSAGIDRINNVTFDVENKSLYRNKLLAQAVENARQEAAVVANAGGRSIGKLLSANINSYNNYPRTYGNIMLKAASADEAAAPSTNLVAESITLKASVDTVFLMQ